MPDPAAGPPDATVLQGFLGKSDAEGVWRLYLTAALNEYVDVSEDEILHFEKLPDDGGTLLWVRSGLVLAHRRTVSTQVQAGFLGGAITRARIGATTTGTQALFPAQELFPPVCYTGTRLLCATDFGCAPPTVPSDTCQCVPQRSEVCVSMFGDCASDLVCGGRTGRFGPDPRRRG